MYEFEAWHTIIGFLGGFIAGVINTLAGNGSTITLSILTEVMGLPGSIANATNRIGVFSQTVSGTWAFYRGGAVNWKEQKRPVVITSLGAAVGIYLAMKVSNEMFMSIFKYLMVFLLISVLVKPSRWLKPEEQGSPWPKTILWPLLFLIGIYGGFIQMGMGVLFLALSVLGAKYNLIKANVMKLIIIGIYTLPALCLFAFKGMIQWIPGLTIAAGQMLGGYIMARFAVKYAFLNSWAYYLLVASVVMALISLFDIL